ncbi:MAG TPA: hypothetical protein VHG10_08695 [Glycomyces sp.]|nr:hypothetical protein [Glycomyces sp.]
MSPRQFRGAAPGQRVLDRHQQRVGLPSHRGAHRLARRVLRRIRQPLLKHRVRGPRGRRRERRRLALVTQLDRHARLHERHRQRRRLGRVEPRLDLGSRAQHRHQPVQILDRCPHGVAHLPHLGAALGVRFAHFQGRDLDCREAEPPPDTIVHVAGEPQPFAVHRDLSLPFGPPEPLPQGRDHGRGEQRQHTGGQRPGGERGEQDEFGQHDRDRCEQTSHTARVRMGRRAARFRAVHFRRDFGRPSATVPGRPEYLRWQCDRS